MESCRVCDSQTNAVFIALVLEKYNVQYYKCPSCGFLQTEHPYWLAEAYKNAITTLDIGLLYRNRVTLPILKGLIKLFFNKNKKFLDYGGGYGVLVRSMRDDGFNMYRYDTYCDNLFADGFDDEANGTRYEIVTAFEVFEHLEDPVEELRKMLMFGDSIFFSTEIQPDRIVTPDNWWYVMPEIGQHIALHSLRSLKVLAGKYDLNFYSNGVNFHLFTRKHISNFLFKSFLHYRVAKIIDPLLPNPDSLLMNDYEIIKQNLKQ